MRHLIADPVIHREHWRDADDDTLRLECGVCGVWGADEDAASAIVALGLHALQHRGQEACGIASFDGLPHRLERVAETHGVAFVNDSKATNADSAARALASYDRVVWIAGGEAKEVVVNRQITRCYLELVSGTVSINTVVVRPEKTALPQTVRLQEGKLHMIDLGGKRAVSGFRISDNGRGVYRVIVQ